MMNFFQSDSIVTDPYKKTEHTYAQLLMLWRALSIAHGFTLEEHVVGEPKRRLLCAKIGMHRREQVLISAGIHGDEPATPWAILEIVNCGLLDPRYGYTIWCCVNPTGYEMRTRNNCDGVDINRTFLSHKSRSCEAELIVKLSSRKHYTLAIDLHEDIEADGFYLYESEISETRRNYGRKILDNICMSGYTLQAFTPGFDLGFSEHYLEKNCTLTSGCVRFSSSNYDNMFVTGTLLTKFLIHQKRASTAFIFETPGTRSWDARIAMHTQAVTSVLELHGEYLFADSKPQSFALQQLTAV